MKTGYLTDVSDEEWAFVLPYLLLSRVDNVTPSLCSCEDFTHLSHTAFVHYDSDYRDFLLVDAVFWRSSVVELP